VHTRDLSRFSSIVVALISSLHLLGEVRGQCEPAWRSDLWVPNGPVWDMTVWDADGAGPQTPRVVAVGEFAYAGTQLVNNVAAYDPVAEQWSPLGIGVPMFPLPNYLAFVRSVATAPNGDIIASGPFLTAGGISARRIARYNAATGWRPLGLGLSEYADSLLVMPNGDVIASGFVVTNWLGQPARGIVRWDGTTWASIGSEGLANTAIVTSSGELIAGGSTGVARWNGTFWVYFGFMSVQAVVELPNGDLVAGGMFGSVSIQNGSSVQANNVARWNGTSWTPLTSGVNSYVSDLAVLPNGELIVAGSFTSAGGIPANNIARWNGSAWSPLGAGLGQPYYQTWPKLAVMPDGHVFAGGSFEFAGGVPSVHFAHWGAPSGCSTLACDSLDFNNDQASFDPQDIDAFLSVYGEGPCIPATADCNDIDFNNDGSLFDPCDINAFLLVYAEGPCTFCGV